MHLLIDMMNSEVEINGWENREKPAYFFLPRQVHEQFDRPWAMPCV